MDHLHPGRRIEPGLGQAHVSPIIADEHELPHCSGMFNESAPGHLKSLQLPQQLPPGDELTSDPAQVVFIRYLAELTKVIREILKRVGTRGYSYS